MKNKFKQVRYAASVLLLNAFFYLSAPDAIAQSTTEKIRSQLGKAGEVPFGTSDVTGQRVGPIIGNIVKVALTFVGTITFLVFLYGGFLWLTARGNDEQVKQAKKYLTNGAIGTIIIILAYSVTFFITDVIYQAAGQ